MIEIICNENGSPYFTDFYNAYSQKTGECKFAIFAEKNNLDPYRNGTLYFRCFVEGSLFIDESELLDKKYILTLQVKNFGDVIMDFICISEGLNQSYQHKYIALEYEKILFGKEIIDKDNSYDVAIAGAHVGVFDKNIFFVSQSGRFGHLLFHMDVNYFSSFAFSVLYPEYDIEKKEIEKGKKEIQNFLDFLSQEKYKQDFYLKISNFFKNNCSYYLSEQNIQALEAMHILDNQTGFCLEKTRKYALSL